MQLSMRLGDFSLSGGLFSGTFSLQELMTSIRRLLRLTLRCYSEMIFLPLFWDIVIQLSYWDFFLERKVYFEFLYD